KKLRLRIKDTALLAIFLIHMIPRAGVHDTDLPIAAKAQNAGDILELRVIPAQGRRRRKGDAIVIADPVRVLVHGHDPKYPVGHGMEIVEACFETKDQKDHQTDGNPHRETEDLYD